MSASAQASFAAALLDPEAPPPAGLVAWNGSDPAVRYAVYRNNVAVSLRNVLRDTFPATAARLGLATFDALALAFVRAAPPRTPQMTHYGADFPAFLAAQDDAALIEAAELARLERLRVEVFHAADADSLNEADWAAVLATPEHLPGLRLRLHPSVRWLDTRTPVLAHWAAHGGDTATAAMLQDAGACSAVLVREGRDVVMRPAPRGVTALLARLAGGMALGEAAAAGIEDDRSFDLAAALAYLIRHRLLSAAVVAPVA